MSRKPTTPAVVVEPDLDQQRIDTAMAVMQQTEADRLLAAFPSIITYWYRFSHDGVRIDENTDDDSIAHGDVRFYDFFRENIDDLCVFDDQCSVSIGRVQDGGAKTRLLHKSSPTFLLV